MDKPKVKRIHAGEVLTGPGSTGKLLTLVQGYARDGWRVEVFATDGQMVMFADPLPPDADGRRRPWWGACGSCHVLTWTDSDHLCLTCAQK